MFPFSKLPNECPDLPNLLLIAYRGSFREINGPGLESDHSPTSSAEVKNVWSYTSTPWVRLHRALHFTDIIPTYLFCNSCSTPLQHELLHNVSDFANSWPASLVTSIHWPTHRWNKLIFQRLAPRLRHSTNKYQSNENMESKCLPCFSMKFVSDDVIMLARPRCAQNYTNTSYFKTQEASLF